MSGLTFSQWLAASLTLIAGSLSSLLSASADELHEVYRPDQVSQYAHQLYVEPHWIGASGTFWYLRESAQGRVYVLVEPDKREMSPLFDHAKLAEALTAYGGQDTAANTLELSDLSLSDEFKSIEFTWNDERFAYDLKSQALQTFESTVDQGDESAGRSPDGQWRAFHQDNNLFIENTATGDVRQLSTTGTASQPFAKAVMNPRSILRGAFDPKAADIRWSWDSRYIATYQIDLRGTTQLVMPYGEDTITYTYPRAMDEAVPQATIYVIDVKSGEIKKPNLPTVPVLYYGGPDIRWVTDDALMINSIERGYKSRTAYSFDVSSQKASKIIQETSDTFVNIYEGTKWVIYDWDQLLWTSDIDGYTHIYLADVKGGEKVKQVTRGNWRVAYPVDIVEDKNEIYFVGTGRREGVDPYYRALYRIKRYGSEPELLTPDEFDHAVYMSPNGDYIVDNISEVDRPTRSVLRRSRDGKIIMELGGADVSQLIERGYQPPEPFHVTLDDDRVLYGVIYRPVNFDEAKRYPVIEQVYTGPHTYNAAKSFSRGLTRTHAQSIANAGFIVLQLDAEGTEGRSRAFLEPAYKNLAEVGLESRIAAITALANVYPQIDLDRVGAFGFSAGGYDVVRMLTRRPGFYKVGVAASGNYDSRWDKADWNEQWLGTDDLAVYEDNSMLTSAGNLKGRLLLAHGLQDENVPVQATRALVEALNAAGKAEHFEVHYYPEGGHFLEQDESFVARRLSFFQTHLGAPVKR